MSEELENQLNDINNGLACLKFEFISFFLKNLSEKKEKLTKKEAQALITDLKIFIKIFTESLIVCYKLDELSEYIRKSYKSDTNCFNFDNYLMFITNLIFTDKIFDSIFYLQQDLIDYEEQDIFEKKLEEISEKEIEDFEISNEFTLNEKTAQNLKRSFRTISATPYENLIVSLKTITSLKTPFFQLKLLHRISDSIEKEIQQFYDRFDKSFDDFIDTDTFLALHIYIIAKSKLKSLISVLNLIEFFSSEKQRLELSGYYLTIYKASVEYILGI